jgi:hypothetical protein
MPLNLRPSVPSCSAAQLKGKDNKTKKDRDRKNKSWSLVHMKLTYVVAIREVQQYTSEQKGFG